MKKATLKKIIGAVYMTVAVGFIAVSSLVLSTVELDKTGTILLLGLMLAAGAVMLEAKNWLFKN